MASGEVIRPCCLWMLSAAAEQSMPEGKFNRRLQELTHDINQVRKDLQQLARRASVAEQRVCDFETQQWVVQRREIQLTEPEVGGGGWGVVKVTGLPCFVELRCTWLQNP